MACLEVLVCSAIGLSCLRVLPNADAADDLAQGLVIHFSMIIIFFFLIFCVSFLALNQILHINFLLLVLSDWEIDDILARPFLSFFDLPLLPDSVHHPIIAFFVNPAVLPL